MVAAWDGRLRALRTLNAHVSILCYQLDLLKRRDSTNYELVVTIRRIADAQGDITNLVTGIYRNTVTSYDSSFCSVVEALVDLSKRLKEDFDREVHSL